MTTQKTNPNKAGIKQATKADLAKKVAELQHQLDQQEHPTPVPTAPVPPEQIKTQPDQIVNPLLDRIRIPGQTYQIPSQGILYTNGELDASVVDGEVHIYPMTTIDEIVVRTPDLLFSGESIEQVFKRCIPSILKPKELFSKDVDFLMVCLRQVSYGEQFEISHTHDCETAKSNEYIVNMSPFIKNTKQMDPTTIATIYNVTLDNGQKVAIKPIRYNNILKIMQFFEQDITPIQQQERMIDTLLGIVESVDGITDDNMITEWLSKIPIKWAKQLSDAIDHTTEWGPDFTTKVKCKDCGKFTEITIPMNPVSFFT